MLSNKLQSLWAVDIKRATVCLECLINTNTPWQYISTFFFALLTSLSHIHTQLKCDI